MSGLSTPSPLYAKPKAIELQHLSSISATKPGETAAEIVAHDPISQRLFVVNAVAATIDVFDIHNPAQPISVGTIDVTSHGAVANSVAVHDGVVAVAVEANPKTDPGRVAFFTTSLALLSSVEVGAQPDMVTFSPDGRYVLTANEGEPSSEYDVDPEGSVSIIEITGGVADLTQTNVRTAGFVDFNNLEIPPSLRVFGPNATVSQDLEPEYIAVSHDSKTAWVTLQEANAVAVIDIPTATVTQLLTLGTKDHRLPLNALDANDRDRKINITTWPVDGLYLPDGIATYKVGSENYLVMANEGDARAYAGFNEETRVGAASYILDPVIFPDAALLKTDAMLGRLRVTNASGDLDHDGDFDVIHSFGGRSISIRTSDGQLVWDSGDQIERITAAVYPRFFNASNSNNLFDDRSDDKGPEPEGIAIGKAFGRTYAFAGLERIGGVITFDITDPRAPTFADYANSRDFTVPVANPLSGDRGPEGIIFIAAEQSPNGNPLVVVANEISGTTAIYEVTKAK